MASGGCYDWQSSKNTVLERNAHMLDNPFMSDVTLTCEDSSRVFHAHKYVLATSSAVFYAMFHGDMAERDSNLHLPDSDEESLQEFLRFLYTDGNTMSWAVALKVIYLSKKYLIPSLTKRCRDTLQSTLFDPYINVVTVFTILEQAAWLDENDLLERCWDLVDYKTNKFVCSEAFNDLSIGTITDLLSRETLTSSELELFLAVFKWSGNQCLKNGLVATGKNRRAMLGNSIYNIRFLAMTREDFVQHVPTSELLTIDDSAGIMQMFDGNPGQTLKWTNRAKRQRAELLYFTRFDLLDIEEEKAWGLNDNTDALVFAVNKAVRFHGVQLFGDANGSEYDVVFNMDGAATFKGKFRSNLRKDGISTFNIFLPKPVYIEANKKTRIWAEIRGPESLFRMDGKQSVQCNDIVMTFFDLDAHDPLISKCGFSIGMKIWGPFYKIFVTPA